MEAEKIRGGGKNMTTQKEPDSENDIDAKELRREFRRYVKALTYIGYVVIALFIAGIVWAFI